jgi:hypothetical protein
MESKRIERALEPGHGTGESAAGGRVLPGHRGPRDSLSGTIGGEAERFGMGPAVVLGQHLGEVAWPVRDGAAADLATGDRKLGDGHGKTAGT